MLQLSLRPGETKRQVEVPGGERLACARPVFEVAIFDEARQSGSMDDPLTPELVLRAGLAIAQGAEFAFLITSGAGDVPTARLMQPFPPPPTTSPSGW